MKHEHAATVETTSIQAVSDAPHAPILFFDACPSFGTNQGVLNLTLTCARFLPEGDHVSVAPVVIAHLRCSIAAAEALKSALEKALLLVTETPGKSN